MITQEQEQLIKYLRESGVGNTVGEELKNMYHIRKTDDRMIPTRDGETHVYIHYPDSGQTPYPLFVNIHGGGFIKDHREQDTVFSKNICSRANCVVIDIDYTPSPEQRYPYALHQCYDAVKWANDNCEALQIDPDRIALCGHSAGGNLVAAITLMNREKQDFNIALQILDYPLLDLRTPPKLKRNADKHPRMIQAFQLLNSVYITEEGKLEATASPFFAPDEMLAGLPEALIFTCGDDHLGEEGEKYAYKLLEAGVPVTARRFLESSHGFVVRRKEQHEEAVRMILDALGRVFA